MDTATDGESREAGSHPDRETGRPKPTRTADQGEQCGAASDVIPGRERGGAFRKSHEDPAKSIWVATNAKGVLMHTYFTYRLLNGTGDSPMTIAFTGIAVDLKASWERNFPRISWDDVEQISSYVSSSVEPADVWRRFNRAETVSHL